MNSRPHAQQIADMAAAELADFRKDKGGDETIKSRIANCAWDRHAQLRSLRTQPEYEGVFAEIDKELEELRTEYPEDIPDPERFK